MADPVNEINTFIQDVGKVHNFVNGADDAVVIVFGGQIPTLRKWLKDWDAYILDAISDQLAVFPILASPIGAGLIGTIADGTVQAALDARAKTADLAAAGGSAGVGFIQAGTDATSRTTQAKQRDSVSIADFGAAGGSDSTVAINAAIDFVLSDGGGFVDVTPPPNGLPYEFTQINVKTGVTLRGKGGVLKLKNGTLTNGATAYYLINNVGYENAGFEDLVIDGNSANNTAYLVADAITCTGAGSRVRNCLIIDAPDSGIMFSQAPRSDCSHNIIRGARDLGIYVNGANSTDKTQIAASLVHSNVISGAALGGIGVKRGSGYLSVIGNAIDDCGNGMTIEDSGAGVYPERLIVSQNTMRRVGTNYTGSGTALTGIYIARLTNATITDNHCYDCEGYGIYARNLNGVKVKGNIVRGNPSGTYQPTLGHSGIVLDDTADGSVDSMIADNTVSDFRARALHAAAILRTTIRGNNLVGNIAQDDGSAALHQGMVILNGATLLSEYCAITGNILSGFNDNGMNLVGLKNSTVSGNIVNVSDSTIAYALRVGTLVIDNIIGSNILKATDTAHQILITVGATTNRVDANLMANATGVERFLRRNTGIATPVGVIVPRWEGEVFITTSGGTKIWQSFGAANTDWLQIG